MRRFLPLLAAALAACAPDGRDPVAPASPPSSPAPTRERGWIVVMHDGPAGAAVEPDRLAHAAGAEPRAVFRSVLRGFAARLTDAQVDALRRDPAVRYVEPDAEARLMTTQPNPPSWGLDRVDDFNLPLDQTFTFTYAGSGTRVYVLDTGIALGHSDFGARASYVPNGAGGDFVGDGHGSAADCHGHGSHVAGTVGGTYAGVAKATRLVAARVVNCSGNGSASMAIAAMEWIRRNGSRPAVVNMSLGYGNVQSVRDAATQLVAAGYVVVAAAGNGDFIGTPQDACLQSPAGAPTVITVGSTTVTDAESSFSNYGACVDILAPGSSIVSVNHATAGGFNTRSGTSMATPHVAGAAAVYLSRFPASTPAVVWTGISNAAVTGTISLHAASAGGATPNRFLRTIW
jgi:subtilisin family serine protease